MALGPAEQSIGGKTISNSRRRRWGVADANRWAEKYRRRISILRIARAEGVDPGTVSVWLRKVGVSVKMGQHFVDQPKLRIPEPLVEVVRKGPEYVRILVEERIFGVRTSRRGYAQLQKYCGFIGAYDNGMGVNQTASLVDAHRTTIAAWRRGVDIPYLAKLAAKASEPPRDGWQWLPTALDAGGNIQSGWIQVPKRIIGYDDITAVIDQLRPLESTYARAKAYGLNRSTADSMRCELFAYLLGMMLGDASKLGGARDRFTSMNLDVQFTKKRQSNIRLGEFVCLCANALGLHMERIRDKAPTGVTRQGRQPSAAFRWASERSPLLAWMFQVCLGLRLDENTSSHPVHMEWILAAPFDFRKRFAQATTDSDGTVKKYVVEVTSVPNAKFVRRLLQGVGLRSAYVRLEGGVPLRTVVRAREAANLPLTNEFTQGYRYKQLIRYKRQSGPMKSAA